ELPDAKERIERDERDRRRPRTKRRLAQDRAQGVGINLPGGSISGRPSGSVSERPKQTRRRGGAPDVAGGVAGGTDVTPLPEARAPGEAPRRARPPRSCYEGKTPAYVARERVTFRQLAGVGRRRPSTPVGTLRRGACDTA